MDFQFELGPEIILSYKRLSYTAWYALAEFIDNSTQAYRNNIAQLEEAYQREGTILTVEISSGSKVIEIKDNSMGMDADDLQHALEVGIPPDNATGRSRYGLGMKTAAFWFGNLVTVTTTKLGNPEEITIELDVQKLANREELAPPIVKKVAPEAHYTRIKITSLNRRIAYKSKTKVMQYLPSFYRIDIEKKQLELKFNGIPLPWSYADLYAKLAKYEDGTPAKNEFDIEVAGHQVRGWAGVLDVGSRKDAGFSLLQSERVIKSWPDSFKNDGIFGSQEGGSNTLINQRVTGELFVDGFDVSHTKDEVLFSDEELDELDGKLTTTLKPLVHYANTRRKDSSPIDANTRKRLSEVAIKSLETELQSPEFADAFKFSVEAPEEVIREQNTIMFGMATKGVTPSKEFKIGKNTITLYLTDNQSINDPYLIIEPRGQRELVIIINQLHPHWHQLESEDSILNFLRHCIYDGIAEWKASDQEQRIDPNTVKLYKDQFLRIPFKMDIHSQPERQKENAE